MRLKVDFFSVIAVRGTTSLQVDREGQQSATPPVGQCSQKLTYVPLRVPGSIGVIPKDVAQRVGVIRIFPGSDPGIVCVVEDALHCADIEKRAGEIGVSLRKPRR